MMSDGSPRFPNKLLIIGALFTVVGGVLLLWSFGYLERILAAWPLLPLIGGLSLLYLRFFRDGSDHYVFFGTSLALSGILFLLVTTAVPASLSRVWPLFMTIVGLSLFAYGMRKHGTVRVTFTIPGVAILVLSIVFLPFSLELIGTEFASFVSTWWPALFVAIGIGLVLSHFLRPVEGSGEEGEVHESGRTDLIEDE